MLLKGYCTVQECQFSIDVEKIPCPTFDNPKAFIYGRINCQYASYGGNCSGKCSILEEYGIEQR